MRNEQPQRPTHDNRDAWRAYWTALGMPWRTEPEIDVERQAYLAERRSIQPDIARGIYPFCDEHGSIKLDRADVEWLLATHESGGYKGPVDWSDPKQRGRDGLDLRAALLNESRLSGLPVAAISLRDAFLCGANLSAAHLEGANLRAAHAESANLRDAYLQAANLRAARLEAADLRGAHLEGAYMRGVHLAGANLIVAHFEGANLSRAYFDGKRVSPEDAKSVRQHVVAFPESLPSADLRGAFFDSATTLNGVILGNQAYGCVAVAGTRWGNVDLSGVKWGWPVRGARQRAGHPVVLGDERIARQPKHPDGKLKRRDTRLDEYEAAVRANRQVSAALRTQGLSETADRFSYRAQVLQRHVLWRAGRVGRAFGSWLLDMVSGYGYKPMRSVWTYIVVVLGFGIAYFAFTNFGITPFLPTHSSPLAWYEALVLSISSFHGRGLFPSALTLGDPIAILAAGEAIIGLLIEITFIATFTQRFFAR